MAHASASSISSLNLPEANTSPRSKPPNFPMSSVRIHLHDFLEKVSDLLVEVKAIEAPIRQVRHEFGQARKKKQKDGRSNSMFAARDSFSYTDEELAEYEREEGEAAKSPPQPRSHQSRRLRLSLSSRKFLHHAYSTGLAHNPPLPKFLQSVISSPPAFILRLRIRI